MMAVAWAALIVWPVVTIALFRVLTLPFALCVSLLGGYLLLPNQVGLDLPLLPVLDKYTIPSISAFLMTFIMLVQNKASDGVLPGWLPRSKIVLGLMGMLVVGAFGTVLTNGDMLVYDWTVIQGVRIYDAFSMLLSLLLVLVPLVLGRRLLASVEGQRALLLVIVIGTGIYTIPAMWEVRMSPQLHTQVYGFFQHSFLQQMRQGGFRPIVFLEHGLTLSILFAVALVGCVGLWQTTTGDEKSKWLLATLWFAVTLVLSKSLGALIIAILCVPIVLMNRPRIQILIAAGLAATIFVYPMLRVAQLVPLDAISSFMSGISQERADSLAVRFFNEESLLNKARERITFGWGDWGRNRIFDEWGNDVSITDGAWITVMGVGGWVRYTGIFGLLCWPIIALYLKRRNDIDPICAILAIMLCAKLIDLIPNAGIYSFVWLIAGSLIGRLEMQIQTSETGKVAVSEPQALARGGYARDLNNVVTKAPDRTVRIAREFSPEQERAPKEARNRKETANRETPSYARKTLKPRYRN